MTLVLPQDPVAEKLKADGFELTEKRLTPDNPHSMVIGHRFIQGNGEFVFRVEKENPASVIIPFYGVVDAGKGLKNAFKDFLWFIDYLSKHAKDLGLKTVRGYVCVDEKQFPQGLSAERIAAFYKKMGARTEASSTTKNADKALEDPTLKDAAKRMALDKKDEENGQWIIFDLKDFTTAKDLYKTHNESYLER